MSQKECLSSSGQIYWSTAYLAQQIHQVGLGFTRVTYMFVWATSIEQAEEIMRARLAGIGVDVIKFDRTSLALKQDLRSYTFIEAVHGVPLDMALELIRSRPFPEDSIRSLNRYRKEIERGRQILAAAASEKVMAVSLGASPEAAETHTT